MANPLPTIIIVALGAAVLGGADAVRALLEQTRRRSPCLDIAICVFVMFTVTAYLLGAVLLLRFVRDARSGDAAGAGGSGAQGHGAAAATDCLAQVSMLVSVFVGFLVAACLIALPPSMPSGGLGTIVTFFTQFAGRNSFVAVAVIAAAAATTSVRCTRRLLRFVSVRGSGNAADAAPAALVSSERFSRTRQGVCFFVFVALFLAAVSYAAAPGGLDVKRLVPGFPWRSPIADVPVAAVGVAIATVAGTTLVARFSRRVRNNAAGAAAPTPTPATGTWRRRFGRLTTSLAGVLAVLYAHSRSGSESDGGELANSA